MYNAELMAVSGLRGSLSGKSETFKAWTSPSWRRIIGVPMQLLGALYACCCPHELMVCQGSCQRQSGSLAASNALEAISRAIHECKAFCVILRFCKLLGPSMMGPHACPEINFISLSRAPHYDTICAGNAQLHNQLGDTS